MKPAKSQCYGNGMLILAAVRQCSKKAYIPRILAPTRSNPIEIVKVTPPPAENCAKLSTWTQLIEHLKSIFFCYFPLKNTSIKGLFKNFLEKTNEKI
ncbi:MAG: hypothetical protein ACI9XO_003197 [Paraglaciecola sp.]